MDHDYGPNQEIAAGFVRCRNCTYQKENRDAHCRRCGNPGKRTPADCGRSDLPWYGLMADEWFALNVEEQYRQMIACHRREPVPGFDYQFTYIPWSVSDKGEPEKYEEMNQHIAPSTHGYSKTSNQAQAESGTRRTVSSVSQTSTMSGQKTSTEMPVEAKVVVSKPAPGVQSVSTSSGTRLGGVNLTKQPPEIPSRTPVINHRLALFMEYQEGTEECIREKKGVHPSPMPCPQNEEQSLVWFNPPFMNAIEPIMIEADLDFVNSQREIWRKNSLSARKNHDVLRAKLIEAKKCAFEVYLPYIEVWRLGVEKLEPNTYPSALKLLRKERAELKSGLPAPMKRHEASQVAVDENIALKEVSKAVYVNNWSIVNHEVRFLPLPPSERMLDIARRRAGKLEPMDAELVDDPETNKDFHEQKAPLTRMHARMHVDSWIKFMQRQLAEDKVVKWQRWSRTRFDEAIVELEIFVGDGVYLEEWDKILGELVQNLKGEVAKLCKALRMVVEDLNNAIAKPVVVEFFGGLVKRKLELYNGRLEEFRKKLWNEESKGLGLMIQNAVEQGQAAHWINICGGIFPGGALQPAVIPRLVWPSDFNRYYEALRRPAQSERIGLSRG